VLVTGAAGFVGLPLTERLSGDGQEVHALSAGAEHPLVPGVRWHRVDLADRPGVERLLERLAPERLVHLAWCTEHGRFWDAPENVLWVERSLHLLRTFIRYGGKRSVMAGTCAEYDWSNAPAPLVEATSAVAPATLYGAAKDALRRVASVYAGQEGVELAWGRVFFPYGPREAPGRLVPSVTRSLLRGEPVATGSADRVRDFMYVEDVAEALAALLDSSVVGPVNVAYGVPVTVGEVVEGIAQLVGRRELIRNGALPARPGEPRVLLADVTRLRDEVGFRPRWALADGLAASVRWWREHAS
jgi:nucleoside-diphosphate-sugar epimerase